MAATKKQSALAFLNNAYSEHNIIYRENGITLSYDFIVNTGTAKILIKIGEKRWGDSDPISIVEYLESKEQQISKALLDNEDAILSLK